MNLQAKIQCLYGPGVKENYAVLQELEELSLKEAALYPYLDEFIAMLASPKYCIRVRGFRLLCLQAKWDTENRIDKVIDAVMNAADDEKPTAVRQALQYLGYLIPYKPQLAETVKEALLNFNCAKYQDSMKPLIEMDISTLLKLLND